MFPAALQYTLSLPERRALATKSMQGVGTSLLQTTCSLQDSTVKDKTYLADQSSQIHITEHSLQKTGEQGPAHLFPCPSHFFLKVLSHFILNTHTRHAVHMTHPSMPQASCELERAGRWSQSQQSAPGQRSQGSWTCRVAAHSSPDTPQDGTYTTQAGNGQPGQLRCLACRSSDKPCLRAQVTVVSAGRKLTGSNAGEKQVLTARDQADAKNTRNYSLLHCWLDSVFLPFISTQFALESA